MFVLLGALLAGNFLGLFVRSGWAYPLSFPVSLVVYFVLKSFPTVFHETGVRFPDLEATLLGGALHTPLVLLGVYLAHRKFKR